MNSNLPVEAVREKLSEFYKTSEPYARHLAEEDEAYFRRYLSLIERYGGSSEFILDAGCGTGLSSYLLSQRKQRVVGVDLSELFLKQKNHSIPRTNRAFDKSPADVPLTLNLLPQRGRGEGGGLLLMAGDILALPFHDASFDLVTSYLVIEFLPDVEKGLEEMTRVLRRGGILIVVAPNQLSPIWPFRDFFRMLSGGPPRPVWCENPWAALRMLGRNLYLSIRKIAEGKPRFLYREPDLSCDRVVGKDSDAVYLANPIDLVKFLKARGFQILKIGSGSNGFERSFPFWAVAVEVVARKN